MRRKSLHGQFKILRRQPTREDILNIVFQMYKKDGLTMEDIGTIIDTFPNQGILFLDDFYISIFCKL